MIRKATEECGEAALAATDELEGLCQDLYQNKGPGWPARRSWSEIYGNFLTTSGLVLGLKVRGLVLQSA